MTPTWKSCSTGSTTSPRANSQAEAAAGRDRLVNLEGGGTDGRVFLLGDPSRRNCGVVARNLCVAVFESPSALSRNRSILRSDRLVNLEGGGTDGRVFLLGDPSRRAGGVVARDLCVAVVESPSALSRDRSVVKGGDCGGYGFAFAGSGGRCLLCGVCQGSMEACAGGLGLIA